MAISFVNQSTLASGLDLDLLYGSRYVALSGNHVTLTGDAYGPFYNPATMSFTTQRQLALDFSPLIFTNEAPMNTANNQRTSNINFGPLFYIGSVHPLANNFTFGWGLYPTAMQGGKFENVDYGNGLSNKNYSNKLVRIELAPALGIKLSDFWSIGASWRLAYTQYDKVAGTFASASGSTFIDGSLIKGNILNKEKTVKYSIFGLYNSSGIKQPMAHLVLSGPLYKHPLFSSADLLFCVNKCLTTLSNTSCLFICILYLKIIIYYID
jgi:long-subunit fatty acid transport protein